MKSRIRVTAATGNPSVASMIDGEILRRSAIIALGLGSVLTVTNQTAAIFGGEPLNILQMALVYILPFIVVSISQGLGARRAIIDVRQGNAGPFTDEPILATVFAHGIPLRALTVGIFAGSFNASIGLTTAILDGSGVAGLAVAPLAQAYILPVLFGLLSQTAAYRRVISTSIQTLEG